MTPFVLGAAGFLGLNLVDELLADGVTPSCGRRKRTNVLALRKRRAPMVEADLDDPVGLVRALRGHDVVFHAAGHYPRLSLDPEGSIETGVRQLDHVLNAAAAAGVRRLIYVSTIATAAPSYGWSTENDTFDARPGLGTYHDLKWEMEQRALEEDRLEVLVACPGACLGPWDLRVGTSALLVGLARGMDPPHPDGYINPIDARDVATALLALARHPSPPRRLLLAADNVRLHPLLEQLAGRYGVRPPSPPLSPADAIALADEEERRAEQKGGRPRIAREIVDLVVHGNPVDNTLATRTLGMSWTPLNRTLDAYDAWARHLGLLPRTPTPLEARS